MIAINIPVAARRLPLTAVEGLDKFFSPTMKSIALAKYIRLTIFIKLSIIYVS